MGYFHTKKSKMARVVQKLHFVIKIAWIVLYKNDSMDVSSEVQRQVCEEVRSADDKNMGLYPRS